MEIHYLKKWLNVADGNGRFDFVYEELEKMDKEELLEVMGIKKNPFEDQWKKIIEHAGFLSK